MFARLTFFATICLFFSAHGPSGKMPNIKGKILQAVEHSFLLELSLSVGDKTMLIELVPLESVFIPIIQFGTGS